MLDFADALGNLSNDDGDGHNNAAKQKAEWAKTIALYLRFKF